MMTGVALLWAELAVGLLALAVLCMDFVAPRLDKPVLGYVSVLGLAAVLADLVQRAGRVGGLGFSGMYVLDAYAVFFKALFVLTAILVLLMTLEYADRLERGQGEFYAFILLATTGMMLLSSASNFITAFLSLELLAITSYILAGYLRGHPKSVEAGMKFFVIGGVSTGTLLYGISFVYGATGSVDFKDVAATILNRESTDPALVLGMVLVLVGVFFKIAAVPFHVWIPDVYEGAPTPVAAFLSVGSKAAGFALLIRVLLEPMLAMKSSWSVVVAVLAAVTLCFGNLAAIPQRNIKRLLGYSSIGQAGYLLVGVAAANELGIGSVLFYLLAYLLSNLMAFFVVVIVSNTTASDEIDDYAGLWRRSPLLAAALTIGLLSLAGVPPLACFFGKFIILGAAVQEGLIWLAAVGAVNIVISLYYYLLVVKRLYLWEATDPRPLPVTLVARWTLAASTAGVVFIGVYPSPFLEWSLAAARVFF